MPWRWREWASSRQPSPAWGVSQAGTSKEASNPSLAGILPGPVYYLPPDDGSPWISTPDLINQAGITVVSNPEELKAADPGNEIAVIVDKEWWDGLGQGWLALREAEGVVLVGARIDIAGFGTSYAEDRNFYTMRYACTAPDRSDSAQAQDYLDRENRAQFRLMLDRIANVAKGSQCLPASPSASVSQLELPISYGTTSDPKGGPPVYLVDRHFAVGTWTTGLASAWVSAYRFGADQDTINVQAVPDDRGYIEATFDLPEAGVPYVISVEHADASDSSLSVCFPDPIRVMAEE